MVKGITDSGMKTEIIDEPIDLKIVEIDTIF